MFREGWKAIGSSHPHCPVRRVTRGAPSPLSDRGRGGDGGGGQVPLALLLVLPHAECSRVRVRTVTPVPLSLQMYIALISLHALIMVGFHFLHCFEEDWTSECGQGSPGGGARAGGLFTQGPPSLH